jgi:tetratricopeptide (TPR) repeat protein
MYPDSMRGFNGLGRVYMQLGRWSEAVPALKRAIDLDPDWMPAYYSLNEIYVDHLGELDEAIALCQQQITFNDQIDFPYSFMGWAFLGKGAYSQARDAHQRALTLRPGGVDYLFRIGLAYRLEGRYREARDAFRKTFELEPAYYASHYAAGDVSERMGDDLAARTHFLEYRRSVEALIKRNPNHANPHLSLAAVLWRLGETASAQAAARRGLMLDPSLHYEHALFLAVQNRRDEAVGALQRAVAGGFTDFVLMKVDFESLANEPGFQDILAQGLKTR